MASNSEIVTSEQVEVRQCGTEGCLNVPEGKHPYCKSCYEQWKQNRTSWVLREAERVVRQVNNRPVMDWCFTKGCQHAAPVRDGRPGYCLACRIAFAQRNASEYEVQAASNILDGVASLFLEGNFQAAESKLFEANRVLKKAEAEQIMAEFDPEDAPSEATELFEDAVSAFQDGDYREAIRLSREAKSVAARAAGLQRSRDAIARRKVKSNHDREFREQTRGHNSPPPRHGRRD